MKRRRGRWETDFRFLRLHVPCRAGSSSSVQEPGVQWGRHGGQQGALDSDTEKALLDASDDEDYGMQVGHGQVTWPRVCMCLM